MNEELKPCPFCGGKAEIDVTMSTLKATAYCTRCNVVMKNYYKNNAHVQKLLEELISKDWNRRVADERGRSDG